MAIGSGDRLGHYVILSAIGTGGMGEVYRARDTTLNRDVAIKVVKDAFASDPDRMSRFEREAHVLATLNHPNIGAIYGLEKAGSVRALILELVDGQTLADRLAAGPLPAEDVVRIARQIADALEAAHKAGIVHRDLKPSNIKVRPDGRVTVLDFGLAKLVHGDEGVATRESAAQATTVLATELGLVVGTTEYMSPEQAQGQVVDKRTDIWSFGVVLFEMLTGRNPFRRASPQQTLASILTHEPDWDDAPLRFRRLLRRALEPAPHNRLRDIGDALYLLDEDTRHADTQTGRRITVTSWAAGVLGIALIVALVLLWRADRSEEGSPMRFTIDAGIGTDPGPTLAISPDGRRIVYRVMQADGSGSVLATRLLSETNERILRGTEGGFNPFFSPDGASIAFFAGSKLRKIPTGGGVPVVLADAPSGRSGHWGEADTIVAELTPFSGIWRVPTQPGTPIRLTRPSLDRHAWPQVLPGAKTVIYSAATEGLYENGRIEALPLDGGEPRVLVRSGYAPRFVGGSTGGYLLFLNGGVLYAVGFDPRRLQLLGEPVQIVDDVASIGTSLGAAFSSSDSGILAYTSGRPSRSWPLGWLDERGEVQRLNVTPRAYYTPTIAPDSRRVALSIDGEKGQDLFVYDIERNEAIRLTANGDGNLWPVWTSDGSHVVFTSRSAAGGSLWWARADGSRPPTRLLTSRNSIRQIAISPNDRTIVYTEQDPDTGSDLWTVPLDFSNKEAPQAGVPIPILKTDVNEGVPAFSPDGRWIAYITDELGQWEVWAQPFPALTGRWQVSTGNGGYIYWSRAASELHYGAQRVAYEVDGDRFIIGRRTRWPIAQLHIAPIGLDTMDLAPDGKRFLIVMEPMQAKSPFGRVTFVINVVDEIRRRMQR